MNQVNVAISSVRDGSMSKGVEDEIRRQHRQRFLAQQGMDIEKAILVNLAYEGDNYCRYSVVDKSHAGDGMVKPASLVSDALFTGSEGVVLFLPVADCIGAVLFDKKNHVLGLAHFGRHNLVQDGAQRTIGFMKEQFGSRPENIEVFLGPGAGKASYPLFAFGNKSLEEVTKEQLAAGGVPQENITNDPRDTARDAELFSHSEFLKGNQELDGRQAIAAMMHS